MEPITQVTISGEDMVRRKIGSFIEIEVLLSVLLPFECRVNT
jgi:hypothetical protein